MLGMTLQQRLRARREARGLRNSQVARTLGISTAHVSDMESGKSKPSLELLARLAELYATSTDYLLGLTDDPTPVGRGEDALSFCREADNLLRRFSDDEYRAVAGAWAVRFTSTSRSVHAWPGAQRDTGDVGGALWCATKLR